MVLDVRAVRKQAFSLLPNTQPPFRQLVVKHGAVALGVQGAILLIGYLLESFMEGAGGLAGMGSIAILDTARSVIQLAAGIFLPFWSLGIGFAALQVARGGQPEFSALWQGLRRGWPIARFYLLLLLLFLVLAVAGLNMMSMMLMFFPMPEAVEEIVLNLDPALLQDPAGMVSQLPVEELLSWLMPFYIVYLAVMAAVCLYINYRMFMSQYLLLEGKTHRALQAMFVSFRMTKGNALQLFKLDLSFWWYGVAVGLIGFVTNAAAFLPQMGVQLPVSAVVGELLCWAVGGAGTLLLLYLAGDRLQTAYACAYETLFQEM